MSRQVTILLGCVASLFAFTSTASAVRVLVNGTESFFDNFEGTTPISTAAVPDSSDGGFGPGVYAPNNAVLGSWNPIGGIPEGTQVTNLNAPGAFEGSNYLRAARYYDGISVNSVPSVSANITASTPGDVVHLETMLYVSSFTPLSGAAQGTRVLALFDSTGSTSIVNIEVFTNGNIFNRFAPSGSSPRTDTGLDIAFDQWKKIAVDYTVGSSNWTLTYDGQIVPGLVTFTGNNGMVGAINVGGGTANATTNPTGTRLYYDAAPLSLPVTMYVDRTTGGVTIENFTGAPIDKIIGYSITSASGALDQDPASWTTITGHYDAISNGGNGTFDNDPWTILTDAGVYTDLSEAVFSGDGGTLGIGAALVLGSPWLKGLEEDLAISLIRDDGSPEGEEVPILVQFIGGTQNRTAFEFGDLDFDNDIDVDDFRDVFVPNYLQTNNGASAALQYQKGDFNGDGLTDFMDFLVLNDAFQAANPGAGALSFNSSVPEPTAMALFVIALLVAVSCRFRGWRLKNLGLVLAVAMATWTWTNSAEAIEVTLNDVVVFADGFEGTSPVSTSPFPDPTDGGNGPGVFTPNNPVLGDWSSDFGGAPLGIQVSNAIAPGAFEGNNYLRAVRSAETTLFPSANTDLTTSPGDIIHVETKLFVNTFTSTHPSGTVQYTRVFGLIDNAEVSVSIVNIEFGSDGFIYNRVNSGSPQRVATGLQFAFDTWKTLKVDYTVGSPTWTLTYDGQTLANGLATFSGNNGIAETVSLGGGNYNATNLAGGTSLLYDALTEPEPYARMNVEVDRDSGAMRIFNESGQATEIDSYRIRSAGNSLDPIGWQSLDFNDFGGSNTWDELGKTIGELSEAYIGQGTVFADETSQTLGVGYNESVDAQDLIFEYHLAGTSAAMLLKADVFYIGGGLEGDHNEDGIVNAADYAFWRDTMGDTPRYNEWRSNFGAEDGSGAVANSVPEPQAIPMIVLALGLAIAVRTRCLAFGNVILGQE